MRGSHLVIFLVAVATLLFFFGLGDMALTDPDETFYAQTAKEMFNANDWITPLIFGKPQFEKPILYYWLVMIGYMIFGVSEFAARFPSAVFGIAGVIGIYFLGRVLFSSLCGFFSGLVLATCMQYIILSRACVTDMVLMVFILFCLLFFLLGWTTGKKRHYLISSVMVAFAVLTKGPIGLFIPGVVVVLYILLSRQWKTALKSIPVGWCILTFLVVCLPWYLAVTGIHGKAFIGEFFGFHNITRFLEPEHRIGTSPFFYIPIIIGGFFPWSLFLPLGAWDMYKNGKLASRIKAYRPFLLIWFLTVFLFFSLSRTKLVTYIFPLFPVMAIVVGRFWERFVSTAKESENVYRYMKISYFIFIISSFLALIGVYIFVRYEYVQALKGTFLAEIIFAAGAILSLFLFCFSCGASSGYLHRRRLFSFLSIIFAIMLLSIPLVKYVSSTVGGLESSKALSLKVKELADPQDAVGGESDQRRGIAFYTDRTDIVDIHQGNELNNFISRPERVWGIIKYKHYVEFKEEKDATISEPLFRVGKYVVVTNKPE